MLQTFTQLLPARCVVQSALAGALLTVSVCAVAGFAQDLSRLNRFVQTSGTADEAGKVFRRGRDLLAQEEWSRAAEEFDGFLRVYPRHKDADAALYWLAYALKKQDRIDDAEFKGQRATA